VRAIEERRQKKQRSLDASDRWQTYADLRSEVWRAIRDQAPGVFRDLGRASLELALIIPAQLDDTGDLTPELEAELASWALRWHLEDFLEHARATLRIWVHVPGSASELEAVAPVAGGFVFHAGDPIRAGGLAAQSAYNPTTETRERAKSRLRGTKRSKEAHLSAQAASARAEGFVEAPEERNREQRVSRFIRHQVLGHTFARIARDDGLRAERFESGAREVSKQVRAFSALLGLELRGRQSSRTHQ